jgi:hypothetical protein
MQCYECAVLGKGIQAVGLCHNCSVGLCREHAVVRSRRVTALYPIVKIIELPHQAREMLCSVCKTALEQDRSVTRIA